MNRTIALKLAGLALVGGVAGFAVGFSVGVKKGFSNAWDEANEELLDQEDQILRRYKVGRYSDPRDFVDVNISAGEKLSPEIMEKALEAFKDHRVVVDEEALAQLKEHLEAQEYADIKPGNVFVQYGDQEVHLDEKVDVTNPNMEDPEPVVISELEFMQEEDFQTITLEWYAGDRVLANENDEIIDDIESTVGINNLNLIGPSTTVLYVRNTRLETVFEIALRLGTYRETVLNLDQDELNNERPRRRSRGLGE